MKQRYTIDRSKFMSSDECKQLIKTCIEHAEVDLLVGRRTWVTRNTLVGVFLRTGLRCSEVANLKIGDLHLGKESYLVVTRGKGNKRRDVYFNGTLSQQLKQYTQIKQKSWNQPITPDSYLFSPDGRRKYTTTALFVSFKAALRKAGLPVGGWAVIDGKKLPPWRGGTKVEGFHPHSARHTYATHVLAATNNLRYTQKMLGHSAITMTVLYADLLPEQNANLAAKLDL